MVSPIYQRLPKLINLCDLNKDTTTPGSNILAFYLSYRNRSTGPWSTIGAFDDRRLLRERRNWTTPNRQPAVRQREKLYASSKQRAGWQPRHVPGSIAECTFGWD